MKKLKIVYVFFLTAGVLLLIVGISFHIMGDTAGAIINFIAGILAFIVSVGFYYKKSKGRPK